MARVVLLNVIMFLLPFVLYGAYTYVMRGAEAQGSVWRDAPFGWLTAAGFALLLLALGLLISFSGGTPSQTYHPPVYEDGQIRPGRLE